MDGYFDEREPLLKKQTNYEKREKESSAPKDDISPVSYFKLFRYATILDRVLLAISTISVVMVGVFQPIMLMLFGQITGDIVQFVLLSEDALEERRKLLEEKLYENVNEFALYTCIVGVATIVLSYVSGALFSYTAIRQIIKIRKEFLQQMLNMDMEWHDMHQTGDFAISFTDNLSKIEEGIGEKVSIFLFSASTFVSGVILALIMGWKLTLVCLISLPLSTVIMGGVSWLSAKFSKQEMESYSSAGSIAEEVLGSVRTVVAFDGQRKETERYTKHLEDAKNNNIKRSVFNGVNQGVLWFFIYGCYALSFWFGVGLIIEERSLPYGERTYTAGHMVAVFCCTLVASWNFGQGAPLIETFGVAKGAAAKVFSVLDTKPKINRYKTTGRKGRYLHGHILFKNVHFNYPSRRDVKILRGLNLEIKSGETVALVGSSGCGKSTCIQLIQRFYDPEIGSVLVDGQNIQQLNLTWLRSYIGVVGQEPALFDTTISENIRYGKMTATQEEIEEAAKKANAHGFIQRLPQGYQTMIGERGAQLSGGQKQRIAIARALVKQPRILLLDEATSALDITSEAEVQAALDQISTECTTVIVAHRLSTVRNADRIIVLSEGKVTEEGSHSQLMERKGVYYNLVISHGLSTEDGEEEQITVSPKVINLENSMKLKMIYDEGLEDISEVEEEEIPVSSLFEIIKANRPEWFAILIGCLASAVTGCGLPVYSVVFGDIIGVLANKNDESVRSESNTFCLYFVILGIVTGLSTFIQIFTFGVAGEQLTLRLRKNMFEAMLKQEMGWFDRKENGVGALCAKLSSEAASVQGASGSRIGTILNSAATFILANVFALYFNWKLALVMLSFSPLILLSTCFEQKIQASDAQSNQRVLERSVKIAVEAIGNIRTVASLGCEETFYNLYAKEMIPYEALAKKRLHFRAIVLGMARSLMLFAYAAGFGYGVRLIIEENVNYGDVFKVCETVVVGSWGMGNAFAFSPNFQKGVMAAGRIFQLLKRIPEIRDAPSVSKKAWLKGKIDYNDVHFSYPNRPSISVLNGLDLSILQGKTVALVGSSGCGKSTIIQLLERFYDPLVGEVTVDNDDIRSVELSTLRSRLGIVSQEPNLFDRTISEKIAYGANHRTVSMEEISEAARNANIHNFIVSLPLGYSTRLGSKGTQLSGGQKQRIAIARALVRKPNVLLLDEATSALDNECEKVVQEALDNAKLGRTCITIAHRLTTIQDADVICVVKDGKIAESGKHDDLIEKKGLYYDFYKLQSGRK